MISIARPDPGLAAVVVDRRALEYADGPDVISDRPRHVRAASGVAAVPGGLAVIQDDANFVAIIDDAGRVTAIELPADETGRRQFDDRRGNKRGKLDLEACVALATDSGTLLIALGSGSSERRERIALVEWQGAQRPLVSLVDASRLYSMLRDAHEFAGSQLNVEGAVALGDRVRLFGRANGARSGARRPVNATCDLDVSTLLAYLGGPRTAPSPRPVDVVQYELGALDGVALGFTDAARYGERILYSASAEDTDDAVADGPVVGSAIGVLDLDGSARWTTLVDAGGRICPEKVEGLHPIEGPQGTCDQRVLAVLDADDPDTPSTLCTLELRGAWTR